MSKLIILRGNSGSGKTTIAKEIQKNFGRNTMLISQDQKGYVKGKGWRKYRGDISYEGIIGIW